MKLVSRAVVVGRALARLLNCQP